jgi:tetratricopeptide (TPR) repeat protein
MTMTGDNFSFGTLLRSLRRRQGLTQQELAEAIGVHRRTLVRWEQGDYLPESKAIVLEVARALSLDDQETRRLLDTSLTALMPYWSVPYPRNPFFTGREEVLEMLHAQLGVDRAVALTQSSALHGLGGVGKTQIALEYAYRHALEYSAVFWIRAETTEQIISSFWQIAEILHLSECQGKEQDVVVTAVKCWLSTHSQWLCIWDNLEDLALLDQFLPAVRSGALLLTTRLQALGTFAQGISLWTMEQEEALLFFLCRAKVLPPGATREHIQQFATRQPRDYTTALEVVTLLGGLPLALDQAGAYIEETQCGLSPYLALLHTRQEALLQQRGERVRDHPASVTTTFYLSMTATAECHPAAGEILQVCALLQPDAIPEELFLQGARCLGETLAAACRDALAWNQVAASACAYSLLHRQSGERTFSMHRLVQAVLKGMLPEPVQRAWKRRVLHAMSQLFPADEKEHADYWQQCERLLPHALLCLTWSEGEEECIALMTHVATYFLARSRFAEAEALYLQARRLGEQTLGIAHPRVGEVLYGLAFFYSTQRKYAEAEALYLQTVRVGEQTLGAAHPQVGEVLCRLALLYGNLGRYAEAEPLYQRVLSIREQALGADHPQVATVLQLQAVLYDDLNRYAEAEPLYQRALRIREQTLGTDHPHIPCTVWPKSTGSRVSMERQSPYSSALYTSGNRRLAQRTIW